MKHSSVGAILLVGGMGTRLRPLTLHRPKALMPILNRAFLSYQFEILKRAGVKHVVLAANPAFKKWQRELLAVCPWGLRLYFVFEPNPRGTGGAIRYGYDFLIDKTKINFTTIVVLKGDVLVEVNPASLLNRHWRRKAEC